MAKEFKIRFRNTAGDLGPFTFSKDATITQVLQHHNEQYEKMALEIAVQSRSKYLLSAELNSGCQSLCDYDS